MTAQESGTVSAGRGEPLVVLDGVQKHFGQLHALKDIELTVKRGPIKVRGMGKAEAEKKARELLDRVGVGHQAEKYPAMLSGGQQQRVAIARALAMEPKVM